MRAGVRSLVSSAETLALLLSEAVAILSIRLSRGGGGGGTSQVLIYAAHTHDQSSVTEPYLAARKAENRSLSVQPQGLATPSK